jgi:hypothetical protein
MKVYILKDSDFEVLLDKLKLESVNKTECISNFEEKKKIDDIYRYFNYTVCRWMGEMKKEG